MSQKNPKLLGKEEQPKQLNVREHSQYPIIKEWSKQFSKDALMNAISSLIGTLVGAAIAGYIAYKTASIQEDLAKKQLAHQIYADSVSTIPKIQIFNWQIYSETFEMKLENVGNGPAIIDNIIYRGPENHCVEIENADFWYKVLGAIPKRVLRNNIQHYVLVPGTYIASGSEKPFLKIYFKGLTKDEEEKVRKFLDGSSFDVIYHSVYNYRDSTSIKIGKSKEL